MRSSRNLNKKGKTRKSPGILDFRRLFTLTSAFLIIVILAVFGLIFIDDRISRLIPDDKNTSPKFSEKHHELIRQEAKSLNYDIPKVAIIIDDLGLDKEPIDMLIELKFPVTLAILPHLRYARYAAEIANKRGWDVMLHLPMDPKDSSGYVGSDAGEGVLLVGSTKEQILTKLDANLQSIPYIKEVNNHMGSKFTENVELMEVVSKRLNSKGIYYVDSRTTHDSKGYDIARTLGMKTIQRDIFLDEQSEGVQYVESQMLKLVNLSKQRGYAVGIFHPYPHTDQASTRSLHNLDKDVEIASISTVLN